ncbi:HlyD family efflux transporter periplasmic adaptor subunit [Pararhodobacter zhoushanensis]|uniref:HlyD family efflux transporter periplasmic adaptor subunit n=1 Tax=Pararhodobacter zhoushanensis TaxID=2479545 RepID=A0ABT3H287_9RHOB|nr:HlyD family efflux transporter periplasmic adaptor subunit [Pararhodobacter zhoushanensis]MCW1933873.1 HlyD family efflux transporter periplasmic adaptor subunit [Pararhodobacter zhoushanensis]
MNDDSFDPEMYLSLPAEANGGARKKAAPMPPLVQPPVYARTRGAAPVIAAGQTRAPQAHAAPQAPAATDPDVRVPDSLRRALIAQQSRAPESPYQPEQAAYREEPQAAARQAPLRRVSGEPRLTASLPQQSGTVEPLFRHSSAQTAQQATAHSYRDEPHYAEVAQPAPRLAAVASGWHAADHFPPHTPSDEAPEAQAWDDEAFADAQSAPNPRPMTDAPQRAPQEPARPLQREPMAVLWQGYEVEAWDWNANGFVLVTPFPYSVDPGRTVAVTLLIGQGIARLSMSVQALCDPIEPTLFSFVGLSRAHVQLLQRISAHDGPSLALMLAEPERSYPELPKSAPKAPHAAQTAAPQAPAAGAVTAPPRARGYRPSLRLLFALAILGGGGALYWDSQSTITSRYAAVTSTATELSVPSAGTLAQLSLREGQPVTTGEILGYVRPRSYVEPEPTRLITLSSELFGTDAAVASALAGDDGAAASTAPPELPPSDLAARADPGQAIVSPCDCVVQQVSQQNGAWIEPGDQLALLVGNEAPTVHALILATTARDVDPGDRATLRLGDGTTVNGSVTRISPDAHWPGFAGLPATVFAAERYARIEVMPDAPLTAPVGADAQVSVRTSAFLGWVHAQIGL